jgi:hypothetical protein
MPLLRSHLTPLLPQLHAPLRRHLAEPVEGFAHLLLPVGRQRPVLLPALTHQLPLLRRHGTPLGKSLLRAAALLRRHGQPTLAAFRERLLPFCRQVVPLALMALQQLLLLRRQRGPWLGCCRGCGGRRFDHSRRCRHGRLRPAGSGSEKTSADKPCPDHFFASCGGGAGGSLPRGGALFKNSHQAASPTSSEPKNSRKPSSGGTDCSGAFAGVVAGAGAGGTGGGG